MNPNDLQNTIEVIKTQLTPLADKIGQGAGWTYELFVRQVYVNAFSGLLLLVPGTILLFFFKKIVKSGMKDSYHEPDPFKYVGAGLCLLIGLCLVLVPIGDLIQTLVNPNYQAIKLIIDLVKTQVQ